jgi:hypothetical protein
MENFRSEVAAEEFVLKFAANRFDESCKASGKIVL